MDYKLFVSTFLLIFVAELGDKTQLAAMARTAESGSAKWIVFAAAASALVVSTLIAVLFGAALTRFIPEKYIRLAAGILFVVFGLLILKQTLTAPAPTPAAPISAAPAGIMARTVLRLAAEFEDAARRDYEALAATAPSHRDLFHQLADEEAQHAEHLRTLATPETAVGLPDMTREQLLTDHDGLAHDVAGDAAPILAHAIEHEEATAGFYRELAGLTPLPALRQIFTHLAQQEEDHARRLRGHIPA